MHEPGPDRIFAFVDLGQRELDQLDGSLAPTGEVGEVRRLPKQFDVIHLDPLGRVRHPLPQRQHPFRLTMRVHVGMQGHGRSRRVTRRRERLRGIPGGGPVEREFGRCAGQTPGRDPVGVDQPPGDGPMETLALAGQEFGKHDLREQSVAEPVRGGSLVDLEDAASDALAHSFLHVVCTAARDGDQQVVVGSRPGDGHDPEQPLRPVRQGGDPTGEDVAQGRWYRVTMSASALDDHVGLCRSLDPGREDLLREERVALGAEVDPLGESAFGTMTEDARQLEALLLQVEWSQVDPLDVAVSAGLGQLHEERMTQLERLCPERPDHHDPPSTEVSDDEREQVPRRGIAPVEVFQDEDQGSVRTEALQQRERQLEQPSLIRRARRGRGRVCRRRWVGGCVEEPAEPRGDGGEACARLAEELAQRRWVELVAEHPEGFEERAVRQALAAEIDAAAEEDANARLSGRVGELGEEPRLPDTRVTADQDDRRFAADGPLEGALQAGELGGSPDVDRARTCAWHRRE